ncbi:MAG TPA: TIR domain-containing protein [Terracidiphilus sp.]|nr:TIR domain-containing protein [Terracidiphilus sp.]
MNEFFWRMFWDAGFTFAIDPQSKVMSHPYLQGLIKRTPGFAAVITYRRGKEGPNCSPFMLYEYSLAVLARKPKLVFFDARLGQKYFPELDPEVQSFNRDDLESDPAQFAAHIRDFKRRAEPYRRLTARRRGKFGILIGQGNTHYDESLMERIEDRIEGLNFRPERIAIDELDGIQLAVDFDKYDFVIIDVGAGTLPCWVHPFVQGRLIPSIKLYHLDTEGSATVPEFLRRELLGRIALEDEPVVFWRDRDDLLNQLDAQFAKLETLDNRPVGSSRFRDFDSGLAYFRSAGRTGETSIFISNAGDANSLAVPLTRSLRLAGITAFQYSAANTIERGTEWLPKLRAITGQAGLFIPLITRSYRESDYCMEELKIALDRWKEGKMTIIPYFIEAGASVDQVLPQGTTLAGRPLDEQVAVIVTEIDEFLRTSVVPGKEKKTEFEPPLDVAFITVLPEEYEAVLRHLERSQPAPAAPGGAANYPSRLGEITSAAYAKPYTAVLAFAGEAGPVNAANATREIIDRWKPRYVLLVGVAGGFPQDGLKKGDVVVSRAIWNYEYGKILDEFQPRMDGTYQADAALVNAAGILAIEFPDWWRNMKVRAPGGKESRPEIKVGAVGSGSKVIDTRDNDFVRVVLEKWPKLMAVEMEGAGAALEVLRVSGAGRVVGFGMIRGISDMPGESKDLAKAQTAERDQWKKYAADAAACLSVKLVQSRWPVPPR